MKSMIFSEAIEKRRKVNFFYDDLLIEIEPYFLAMDKFGHKVVYGKVTGTDAVRKFEFFKISNLRVLLQGFAPALPLYTGTYN
ncbi:MAG: hypothetical protein HRU80_06105 [Ignavibacteriales bacterium]|nr:hypothetical protein [Ignavibacteriaceae bacterium]MCK6615154.1 hypothetical protein [Ignavibacteriaceae bacterium]QOJ28466.1 MAG: hypothetical protein HRU80_06105 [Ignavibacteriales bacterium]